ncbi:zonular occludens toxin [Pseudomonas sp. ABC1]|uniref:zonular occludens toxin domain-containing protein n=1 Tax=Pseudomonas sp. ABC1 TaxID=2748080 RepID=UPI0015C38190|nr:zonular occludens toxin domain-containing protein [Pseudomonas sp. ABC1]QLF92216.1 zonular occludens toxin [Pseudomonas sp. ABC1]
MATLVFRTGLMGHGKTLNSIKEIDQQASKETRLVYFHNIDGLDPQKLKATWLEFDDPLKWYELPDNSIIVIDEAQRFFPPRSSGTPVPPYCSEVETARHKGFELNLITQDFRLLDVHLRRLCDSHIHYWRPFGLKSTSRYQFQCATDFGNMTARKDGQFTRVKIDKKYFDVYKSASHHNVKAKLPLIFYALPALAIILVLLVYYLVTFFTDKIDPGEAEQASPETVEQVIAAGLASAAGAEVPQIETTLSYYAAHTPRLDFLPSSAPVYDDVTKPASYPDLNCGVLKSSAGAISCMCYTRQITRVRIDPLTCFALVDYGYFDHARPSSQQAQGQGAFMPSASAGFSSLPISVSTVSDAEKNNRPWRR